MSKSYSQSTGNHSFAQVPHAQIPRSSFKRSSGWKGTFDAGYLIPIFVDEVLPGDTFTMTQHLFGRLNTPIVPIMDNIFLDSFYFFVPNRLVWDNWQRFNGEQTDPGDSTDYLVPVISSGVGGFTNSTVFDYAGIPTKIANLEVNALPFRGMNLCWNEWFRDQNLQDSLIVDRSDGSDPKANFPLVRRGKRHDYFTSCLPFPQKGPAVELPLGTSAPVIPNGLPTYWDSTLSTVKDRQLTHSGTTTAVVINGGAPSGTGQLRFGQLGTGLEADLSAATAATINQLREAFQIQKLYERDARGGTRYTEIVRSHFGVTSPDARLQRPELLATDSVRVTINPVTQQSESTANSPQANLAAFGVVSTSGARFSKSFTEHGFIIGFVSARADLTYQNSLNRMWSRQTRFDYYWPALSHIGEQAVLNKEIFAQGTAADDNVFGYQERYGEYRYRPSIITSQFRSDFAQSLDIWHLAQDFATLPVLNAEFIEENPPIDRVIATPTEPHFKMDAYFDLNCVRPMPMYGVPGLIDHF